MTINYIIQKIILYKRSSSKIVGKKLIDFKKGKNDIQIIAVSRNDRNYDWQPSLDPEDFNVFFEANLC